MTEGQVSRESVVFKCAAAHLRDALTTVGRAADASGRGDVWLEGVNGDLRVCGGGEIHSASVVVSATAAQGRLLVEHGKVAAVVEAVLEAYDEVRGVGVQVSQDESGAASVKVGGYCVPVEVKERTDLPSVGVVWPTAARVETSVLVRGLRFVRRAVYEGGLAPLEGIRLGIDDGLVRVSATDRFQVAAAPCGGQLGDGWLPTRGVLLDADRVTNLVERFEGDEVQIGAAPGDNGIVGVTMSCGGIVVRTRSLYEEPTVVDRLVEYDAIGTARVDRVGLLSVVTRAEDLLRAGGDSDRRARVSFAAGRIEVCLGGRGARTQSACAVVDSAVEGRQLWFDVAHLGNALRAFDGQPEVTLHVNVGPRRPVVVTEVGRAVTDRAGYRYGVMPQPPGETSTGRPE